MGDGNKYLETLKLFAYGNYGDYKSSQAKYIDLESAAPGSLRKLKVLSIVDMADRDKALQFWKIQDTLDLSDEIEVEDLVLECIYNKLIFATIEENKVLHVDKTFGRDPQEAELDGMIDKLESWVGQVEIVQESMKEKLDSMNKNVSDSQWEKEEFVDKLKKQATSAKDKAAKMLGMR